MIEDSLRKIITFNTQNLKKNYMVPSIYRKKKITLEKLSNATFTPCLNGED